MGGEDGEILLVGENRCARVTLVPESGENLRASITLVPAGENLQRSDTLVSTEAGTSSTGWVIGMVVVTRVSAVPVAIRVQDTMMWMPELLPAMDRDEEDLCVIYLTLQGIGQTLFSATRGGKNTSPAWCSGGSLSWGRGSAVQPHRSGHTGRSGNS